MLKWTEEMKSNKECPYTHVISETPLGQLRIEWKGWKDPATQNFDITLPWGDEKYISYLGHDLASSQAAVQKLWDEKLVSLGLGPAGWLPVDTAPMDGRRVLVTDGQDCYVAAWRAKEHYLSAGCTHWMPLPEVPQ